MFDILDFRPIKGLASPHLQMFLSVVLPSGKAPPSKILNVKLSDGDHLSCHISTPPQWQEDQTTVILIHGLGGSQSSPYLKRLARKFYAQGYRVVRVNLRGCGSGKGFNTRPYYAGNSEDIREVLTTLKESTPSSPFNLVGFSLGGSIILKMAGELENQASELIHRMIAVCPALDLAHTHILLSHQHNRRYHKYFLSMILKQAQPWVEQHFIESMHDFNHRIIAPHWGYADADEYYSHSSAINFIPKIGIHCDILLAADDPFIDHTVLKNIQLKPNTKALLTNQGAHLGFIGRAEGGRGIHWLDEYILNWNKQFQ